MLLPAAGSARRMRGADKLLEPVEGRPVLATLAARALDAGAPVLVTLPGETRKPVPPLPALAAARRAALAGLPVHIAELREAAEGMSASLRRGAAAAAGRAGLMVLPADMPEITAEDIAGLIDAFTARPEPRPILRASTEDGRPGHPVILPARLFPELARISGDSGGREVLRRHADALRLHPLAGARAVTDLDTPEAWRDWRAGRAAP